MEAFWARKMMPQLRPQLGFGAMLLGLLALAGHTFAAPTEINSTQSSDTTCMPPVTPETEFFRFPPKAPPYRIALVNGSIANSWRIQMVQTARAYATQPEIAGKLEEFKVVSTGEDVAAQVAAVENFIDSGYDAVVVNAQDPEAFGPAIRRAQDAGVVLVAFDNTLDTQDAINVEVDQKGLGALWAKWLIDHLPDGGKILEVRGIAGTSIDAARHEGIHETLDASGKPWDVVEVMGQWDDAAAQKATAEAISRHGVFDGITAQGGDAGVVQAMIDAGHPFVPFGGETENGFRKLCSQYSDVGLTCLSAGAGPAQVAVALKTAIAALEGQVVPQAVKLPLSYVEDPYFREGENFYSDQSDNFFVGNAFPECGISFAAQEIFGSIYTLDTPEDPRSVQLLFATNRKQGDDSDRITFTDERNAELTFGSAKIHVPEDHKLGQIELPGTTTILYVIRIDHAADPKKHFIIESMSTFDESSFMNIVRSDQSHQALVFVHGYNTTFEESIFRLAQIVWDMQYRSIPIVFAWPSDGSFLNYAYDRESALVSRDLFIDLLMSLKTTGGATTVNIIAHSMGNFLVLEALRGAAAEHPELRIGELVLAAPDVDRDGFGALAERAARVAHGITLYASSRDKALVLSRTLARVPRAGDVPTDGPIVLPQIDTIDVTAIGDEIFGLNHDTFASNRSLIDDIGRILFAGERPPNKRTPQIRGVPEGASSPRYWLYPN